MGSSSCRSRGRVAVAGSACSWGWGSSITFAWRATTDPTPCYARIVWVAGIVRLPAEACHALIDARVA